MSAHFCMFVIHFLYKEKPSAKDALLEERLDLAFGGCVRHVGDVDAPGCLLFVRAIGLRRLRRSVIRVRR
eukprot:14875735-Heterocapsa_arctica.AAC.1